MKELRIIILNTILATIVFCFVTNNSFGINYLLKTTFGGLSVATTTIYKGVLFDINSSEFRHEFINEEENEEEGFEDTSLIYLKRIKIDFWKFYKVYRFNFTKLNPKPLSNYLYHYLYLLLTFF